MEIRAFVYEHPKFGKVHGLTIDGEPKFVGNDIATALGYKDTVNALKTHVPDKFKCVINAKILQQMASESKGVDQNDGSLLFEFDSPRGLTFIDEAGLYKLILRSKMPAAEEFSDWVCEEVLPSIRKSGLYTTSQILTKFFESAANAEPVYKCIYIHEMSNGKIKIGNTQYFLRRMRQIETGSGLNVVRSSQTDYLPEKEARKLERDCHESFADDRILGEYFSTPFEKAHDELNRLKELNTTTKP